MAARHEQRVAEPRCLLVGDKIRSSYYEVLVVRVLQIPIVRTDQKRDTTGKCVLGRKIIMGKITTTLISGATLQHSSQHDNTKFNLY